MTQGVSNYSLKRDPNVSRYSFARDYEVVSYTPHKQITSIDYQVLKRDLESTEIIWSDDQLKRIVEISKELLNSDTSFLNITTENEPLFKTHKIHVFAEKEKQKVRIYINPRNIRENEHAINTTNIAENEGTIEEIEGTDKRFTKAARIKLKFDSEKITSKVTLAACLRMKLDCSFPSELVRRFNNWRKEIKILTLLRKKPNICKLQNWAEYQGNHKQGTNKTIKVATRKIVMYQDLYESDLHSASHRILNSPLKDKDRICLQIIRDTAQGLSQIHQAGYLHVDLKPENIFLDKDLRAYIGDFGLAVKINEFRTAIGTGTPSTFAPENLTSAINKILNIRFYEAITTASDIWALGCSLVRLYNDSLPPWSDFIETLMVATNALIFSRKFCEEYQNETQLSPEHLKTHFPELYSTLAKFERDCDSVITDLIEISRCSPEEIANYFTAYPNKEKINEIERLCIEIRNYLFALIENPDPVAKKHLAILLNSKLFHIRNHLSTIIYISWGGLPNKQLSKASLGQFIIQNMLLVDPEKRTTTRNILNLLKV